MGENSWDMEYEENIPRKKQAEEIDGLLKPLTAYSKYPGGRADTSVVH